MKTIAIENGIDTSLAKPAEMGGAHGDQVGAAGGGLVIALQALLHELPRLRVLPQFTNLHLPYPDRITIMLQGFGVVGAQTAKNLIERLPGARVVGISDTSGYLFNPFGLPVDQLFKYWQEKKIVCLPYYNDSIAPLGRYTGGTKFSNAPEDLLKEDVFCFIPAQPQPFELTMTATLGPVRAVGLPSSFYPEGGEQMTSGDSRGRVSPRRGCRSRRRSSVP